MKSIIAWSRRTSPIAAIGLIRLVVGGVFLVEGWLKFAFPGELGAGRFARIGIPAPGFFGPFVAGVEVVCGALVIVGLLTRLAAIPLLIDITVALVATKLTVLLGHAFGPFSLTKAAHYGLLGMIHEARTDLAMFFGLLFLLVVGAGSCSIDALSQRRSG